jgi:hypothetical protein
MYCPGDLTLFSFNLFSSNQAEEGRDMKKEHYRSEIRAGGKGSNPAESFLIIHNPSRLSPPRAGERRSCPENGIE